METLTRTQRRQRKNRDALISAGHQLISAKGIDATTMGEIAELADLGSGTVYNYFASKDDLVMAVMEQVMRRLAERIELVTNQFAEPGHVYAFGVRSVMLATIEDPRWRGLLNRTEVIADAMRRVMGPFAVRDIIAAREAGAYSVSDPELVWRLATHAIVGFGLSVNHGEVGITAVNQATVALLGMVGVSPDDGWLIVDREWPPLPPE